MESVKNQVYQKAIEHYLEKFSAKRDNGLRELQNKLFFS